MTDDTTARLAQLEAELEKLRAKQTRAHPLPEDWEPKAPDLERLSQSYPQVRIAHETDKFRDYYRATGKSFKNWDAAFRNWIRKASEFSPAPVTRLQAGPAGRAASLSESNRAKRDRALDKLAQIQQGAAARKI